VKHAGAASLDLLEGLLRQIRSRPGLKEKSRGVFYFRSRAILHFHEDAAGLFADLRTQADWDRYPVNTTAEQLALLADIAAFLGDLRLGDP
jgi:hypothetical protein